MIVNVDGRSYVASWLHKTKGSKKGTTCILKEILPEQEQAVEIAQARSHLHRGDTFSKNIGRIRSLTKVLDKKWPHGTGIFQSENRAIRRLFWEAYQKMRGGNIVQLSNEARLEKIISELRAELKQYKEDQPQAIPEKILEGVPL